MTDEDRTTLAALTVQMCRELLAANGEPFELVLTEPAPAGDQQQNLLVAAIGLGRPDLRGALVLAAHQSLFRVTAPPELAGKELDDADLADWAGEMANQLAGRLKNRLCHVGLDFITGTPTVVRGDHMDLRLGKGPDALGLKLRVKNERLDVYLEVKREDGNSLLAAGTRPATASAEGDVVLF